MSATDLPASRQNKARPLAGRLKVSPPERKRDRFFGLSALWAGLARNLLVLFIISHHILLIGAMLGAIEWAVALASAIPSNPWDIRPWVLATSLGWLSWMLS